MIQLFLIYSIQNLFDSDVFTKFCRCIVSISNCKLSGRFQHCKTRFKLSFSYKNERITAGKRQILPLIPLIDKFDCFVFFFQILFISLGFLLSTLKLGFYNVYCCVTIFDVLIQYVFLFCSYVVATVIQVGVLARYNTGVKIWR